MQETTATQISNPAFKNQPIVVLASVFSDHMVLQRSVKVPVWGWAQRRTVLSVKFAGQNHTATAGEDGRWEVSLDPLEASSKPQEMVIDVVESNFQIVLRDILVGEVWLASGQSNMQWPVSLAANGPAETSQAHYPLIRFFQVPNVALLEPQSRINASWTVCQPETAGNFSAVAYFFGRELKAKLNVPIGLIDSSWGGTRIQAWISRSSLASFEPARNEIEAEDMLFRDPAFGRLCAGNAKHPMDWERANSVKDPGNEAYDRGWAALDLDESSWETIQVPKRWQEVGYEFSGVFWFRRTLQIPADWKGSDLILELGALDKHDTTYFNNTRIGGIGWEKNDAWNTPRIYRVPAALVQPGKNVIATRVYSYVHHGGMIGPADTMKIAPEARPQNAIQLNGEWKYEMEHNLGFQEPQKLLPPPGNGNPQTAGILFNSMIQPVVPFALVGVLWYQGESNASEPEAYAKLLPMMIKNWRHDFRQELPFYIVQLTSYMELQAEPIESGWAELREAQQKALSLPKTALAITLDLGDAADIHPTNKQDVAKRLALLALAGQYGLDCISAGPTYQSHVVESNTIRVTFANIGSSLRPRDSKEIKGFAIAGPDGKFHWADARIEGAEIILQSEKVPSPVSVRYAWANNPVANVENTSGLPMAPFRTDVPTCISTLSL